MHPLNLIERLGLIEPNAKGYRADQPALTQYTAAGAQRMTRAELRAAVAQCAALLSAQGIGPGSRIALFAPNSMNWIITALGALHAGAAIVPIDSQMSATDLAHVIDDAAPDRIYTEASVRAQLPTTFAAERILDIHPQEVLTATEPAAAMPQVEPDQLAALFYTSGTTGPPKGVPLTHHNLASNVSALLEEHIAECDDRILLPLPLHHVYPLCIGLLTALAVGAEIILPRSLVGARIADALRRSDATILLGVPRLYEALWSRLQARVSGGKAWRKSVLTGLLTACTASQRLFSVQPGRWLFRPLMRRLAPQLRVAVSGGAALDADTAARLQALGWQIATGYGLTETSPILTLNPPTYARLTTAGRTLSGVDLCIRNGEVCARGPNVFAGYWGQQKPTASGLDEHGWLRTGDGGHLDERGFLHLTGRLSATIVLPGGENIDPERIEQALGQQTAVREAGVLAVQNRLTAVVVIEPDEMAGDPQQSAEAAADTAQTLLPGHHTIHNVVISPDPLPRTRLGKLRRHRLQSLHAALTQPPEQQPDELPQPIRIEMMSPDDQALLSDPVPLAAWSYLSERFAERRLTPDSRLSRDLGVDSLGWVEVSLALQERTGVELSDAAVGRIITVRDLLNECLAADVSGK